MKKNRKRIIFISFTILLFTVLFIPSKTNAETISNGEYANGTLKCPDNSEDKCRKENNSVIITEQEGDFSVKKTVTKVGEKTFKVKIEATGRDETITSNATPYVVLILDNSTTVGTSRFNDKIIPAAKVFAKSLFDKFPNAKLAVYKFNKRADLLTSNSLFYTSYQEVEQVLAESGNREGSRIRCAFKAAVDCQINEASQSEKPDSNCSNITCPSGNGLSSDIDSKNTFIIFMGDGRYGHDSENLEYINNFKNSSITKGASNSFSYGIGFGDAKHSSYEKNMTALSDRYEYVESDSKEEWEEKFKKMVSYIIDDNDDLSPTGTLIDNVGKDFNVDKSNNKCYFSGKSQVCSKVSFKNGQTFYSDEFTITLKSASLLGDSVQNGDWYKTNNGFYLSYNGEKKIESNLSARVYWKEEDIPTDPPKFECKEKNVATKTLLKSEKKYYYKHSCYLDEISGEPTIQLHMFNGDESKFMTNIDATYGVGMDMKIAGQVKCQYEIDDDLYQNDKAEINNEIAYIEEKIKNIQDEGLKKEYRKVIKTWEYQRDTALPQRLKESKTSLGNKVKDDKKIYANILKNKDGKDEDDKSYPVVKVRFHESDNKYKKYDYQLVGNENSTSEMLSDCNNINKDDNTGSCTFKVSKELVMPESCLSLSTGKMAGIETAEKSCSSTSDKDKYLTGQNKFYPDLEDLENKKNTITFTLEDFFGSGNNITIGPSADDSACIYNTKNPKTSKILYREISVSDPFNKSVDSKRGVGLNWDNSRLNLNFQQVIDANTWGDDFKTLYKMPLSKVQVSDINKDTNDGKGSTNSIIKYTGDNCKLNGHIVYCPLVHQYASEK